MTVMCINDLINEKINIFNTSKSILLKIIFKVLRKHLYYSNLLKLG
jgi:hypothetical protein